MKKKSGKFSVVKASGERELFDEEKVRNSIRRAGIPLEVEDQILEHVNSDLYDNIPTKKIYQNVLGFLKQSSYSQGEAKYSLKQAIMSLGPSGYPFENYLAEILKKRGYTTETGLIVEGRCTSHEIDVLAEKKQLRLFVECKFHNRPGLKTDIKVALYVRARFDDIAAALQGEPDVLKKFNQPWLATNTKFTRRTIRYGKCAGLSLLGWNYPKGDSLRDWVEKAGLYPLTCLRSLSRSQKAKLLEEDIVLCQDLLKGNSRRFRGFGFSFDLIKEMISEASLVCGSEK